MVIHPGVMYGRGAQVSWGRLKALGAGELGMALNDSFSSLKHRNLCYKVYIIIYNICILIYNVHI